MVMEKLMTATECLLAHTNPWHTTESTWALIISAGTLALVFMEMRATTCIMEKRLFGFRGRIILKKTWFITAGPIQTIHSPNLQPMWEINWHPRITWNRVHLSA